VANGDVVVFDIERVIEGSTATVRLALAVGLAEGPLLIQGVPGVGKVKLDGVGAGSIDCSVRRSHVTGSLLAPAEAELAALRPRAFAWRAASAETVAGGVR
jgi:MoxR-like ATPase